MIRSDTSGRDVFNVQLYTNSKYMGLSSATQPVKVKKIMKTTEINHKEKRVCRNQCDTCPSLHISKHSPD